MELTDFNNCLCSSNAEQLLQACDYASQNYSDIQGQLQNIIKAAPAAVKNDEDKRALDMALMLVAAQRDKSVFPDIYRLGRQVQLAELFPEESWLMANFHRFLASTADLDDIGAIGDLALEPQLPRPVREQALLAYHFLWLEKIVPEKDIIDEYRRLLEQGLSPEDDWQLWMALVINAAVVGGNKLKPQVMSIIDAGRLSDQTSFVRKVVNGLFTSGNRHFRQMLKNEHRGFFSEFAAEIGAMLAPPQHEDIEMPERGKPIVREEPKVGRNDPCPCGSGKKFKKCCGADK